ncbi:hypothetical protein Tco_0830810 [Tanacetum coccineum]
MALESLRAVVLPKFDMHIYTSDLTFLERKTAIEEYCIPLDLHPRLPNPDMTMNRLPSRYIELYVEQLEQGGLRILFLPSFLWFSISCANKDIGSLSRIRPVVALRNALKSMDTFLKLPSWTGTVVSRGDPIPDDQRPKPRVTPPLEADVKIPKLTTFQKNLEKPNPKIVAAWERKEKQNLAKAGAKHDGAEANEGPKKKQRVQKHHVSIQSGSEGTLSITHLQQAEPAVARKSTPPMDAVAGASFKEVVDLNGNTLVPTPPAATTQPSAHTEPPNTQEHAASDGHEGEPVNNRYVPNWGLHNDLRVCTLRAYREMVSHLATLTEDEFLGNLSNVEVVSRAYQTPSDANSEELDRMRLSLQRANHDNEGLNNKLSLLDNVHSECPSREKELLEKARIDFQSVEANSYSGDLQNRVVRGKNIVNSEIVLDPWGDHQLSVSDAKSNLAFRMKTTCKAAHFPCRLLAMLCRFPVAGPWAFLDASPTRVTTSQPGEMAPESLRAVVLPKFDMHIYTSDLTFLELKTVIKEYCIPLDLHPCLPHPDMMMNQLPSRYIELYVEQLEQGGLRIPFSSFFLAVFYKLCKQGHWFSFENKTVRGTRKCFKENLEKPNPKIVAAWERKEKQNLAKARVKHDGAEANEGPKKKQRVQKHHVSIQSRSEGTPIEQLSTSSRLSHSVCQGCYSSLDAAAGASHVRSRTVNLSGIARVPTPPTGLCFDRRLWLLRPGILPHPRPILKDPYTQYNAALRTGHEGEPVNNRYVPNWGLHNDLRVCTLRAYREMVSHLATPQSD